MLLPVVIDVDAVDDQSSEGARLERENLLDRLLEYGLPHIRAADMKKFVSRLKSIPASESQRWTEAMRSIGINNFDASGVLPSDMEPVFAKRNALVVLSTSGADGQMEVVGLKAPIARVPRTQIEYVAASHVRQSDSIRKREEWATEDLWPNTSLDLVGDQRFAPLFRSCRRISLVDRYAFVSFRYDVKASGLSWLVRQIAANSQKPCKVSLYSIHSTAKERQDPFEDFRRWIDALEEQCAGMNGELNLFLGPDNLYRELAHDRYLRVDDSRIIDLGKGVDAFSGGKVKQRCPFSYRVLKRSEQLGSYRQLENQLREDRGVMSFNRTLGTGFE